MNTLLSQRWKAVLIIILTVGLFTVPIVTLAGDPPEVDSAEDVANVLINILGFFYTLFFVFAAASFLYSAYLFASAGGDADKVSKAKKALMYTIVAVVVGLMALGADELIADFIDPSPPGGSSALLIYLV